MKTYSYLLLFCFFSISVHPVSAQKRIQSYLDYIDKYSDLAIKHMNRYKIPASIILSQGILETKAGKSSLVKESNNHFGIKCHLNWKGDRVYRADDNPYDCFRSYNNAEDSFEDHSRFLTVERRYADLFILDIKDYKAWARGLQKKGYATDPAYANKLIKIIELYELYKLDAKIKGYTKKGRPTIFNRTPYIDYGLVYVIAGVNDNYEKIANDMGFKVKDLIKYNEVPEDFPVFEGDIVFLQKKHKKAQLPYFEHIVQIGESMHKIAQRYGMQVKYLYKLNKKKFDYIPVEGDVLRLQ
ncbi:MAG: glucosaminidase domain-containing protein [Dysgonamonadaceae bacterium]|jgi:LysM repeat protein|nr:glucosaminidase domain-containing protein [Dysgonamonadaceae bacterium]